MEALDNPSYFSLPPEPTAGVSRGTFSLLRRRAAPTAPAPTASPFAAMGATSSSAASTGSSSSCITSSLLQQSERGGAAKGGSCSAPTTPTTPEAGVALPPPAAPVPATTMPHPGTHRRSFRALLRSVSANSATNAQLLVLGEPRPSDMAPASPGAMAHRRHRSKASTLKSPKSSLEILDRDMIYCPTPSPVAAVSAPTTPADDPDSPTEEIFLGNGDARYYNLTCNMTIPLPGSSASSRRRHSIGTFLSRERAAAAAARHGPVAVPSAPAAAKRGDASAAAASCEHLAAKVSGLKLASVKAREPAPPGAGCSAMDHHFRSSHTRRRCNRCCSARGGRTADMDDILIVTSRHSQAATLWINYLTKCFNSICQSRQKPPYKILNLGVEDIVGTGNMSVAMEEKMVRVKLQIVILCPQFLEHIYENSGPASILTRLLQPDRVLAMLLGVDESSITEQHQAVLPSYQQWQRMQVKDQDESFVGDFLGVGLTILARVSRQQLAKEKALFSIVPKKVNEGQNKVILLLNEPMTKDDVLKIKVNKNGEFLDVIGAKRRNPYTLYFQIPECCLEVSMLVSIHVEKNGQDLGSRLIKCESRMRELDQLLRTSNNPLDFMCQTLGFSPGDRDHLDNFLVTSFQRNLPPHFNLLQTPGDCHQHRTHASPEEYPTLLHFAARFGLEKFAWQLLECPGGTLACEIRNVCDLTPAEMAEAANHPKLAHILRGYMQMTEFTIMYDMLGKMSEGNSKKDGSNNNYSSPRRLSDTYQIPQSTRTLVDIYDQVPPLIRPITPPPASPKPPVNGAEGYMEMLPRNPSINNNLPYIFGSQNLASVTIELSEKLSIPLSPSETTQKLASQCQLDQISLDSAHDEKLLQTGVHIKKSTEHVSQGVQDELLEIINDFKNNVFTISEVEKLVENWKNRNDVQRSFREKQEQLTQMREQYEVLQQQMKTQMKRPTPFDRIRKIFRGKSKEPKDSSNENSCTSTQEGNNKQTLQECPPGCTRPISSLSIHSISSSSSGRMSTLSGCSGTSMGDSGTHSDTDDRKAPFCPVELTKSLGGKEAMPNYAIPPAPRVVSPLPVPVETCITNIENRPPEPVPRPESDPYVTPNDSQYVNTGETMQKQSIWKETEEKISVMISANSEVTSLEQNKRLSEPEYLEALPNAEYINISYAPDASTKGESGGPESNDVVDMPEYVNVSMGSLPAPPVPPRVPAKMKN